MAMALIGFTLLFGVMLACARSIQSDDSAIWSVSGGGQPAATGEAADPAAARTVRQPGEPVESPTPDDPHALPALRSEADTHTIQAGETLGLIANQYGVSIQQLAEINNIANPDLVEVGQVLTIPAPSPSDPGPDFKIIPDSELVNGPGAVGFNLGDFITSQGGFLSTYEEEVEGKIRSAAQIVERIALEYSVNPRLLLAVIEYQSGWVTQANPQKVAVDYPAGLPEPRRKGLYRQLAWAANALNRGYYTWRVEGTATWLLVDGTVVPIAPTLNAGTAGVQSFFAQLLGAQAWQQAVSQDGLFATYNALFGYPFDYAVEPVLPPGLAQPTLQLPFEPGTVWAFTGGPHGGWGDGSAWAGLDFAPPGKPLGCVQSDAWVVASAGGLIVRTGNGAVVQDLDGDGFEQTGWTILYMHIETRDRVEPGTFVQAGERIGHPSCEGGVSSGTHVHLARKYNGEWIPADQDIPFQLDGWVSSGVGAGEYDGFLSRDGQTIEAYAGRNGQNDIQR